MKNSLLGFILTTVFSFQVSAYDNSPPPEYNRRYDKRYQGQQDRRNQPHPRYRQQRGSGLYSGFDYNNRFLKLSLGSASIRSNDFIGDRITYEDTSFLPLTVGLGVENGPLAVEAEFFVASNDIDRINGTLTNASVTALGLNANLLFRAFFSPVAYFYAGGGLGTLVVGVNNGSFDTAAGSSLSVQGIIGGEFRPNQRTGLFMEYKLLTSLGLELEDDFNFLADDYKYTNSSLNVGFRMYY